MLDRITQPEKFVDAERAGADWIETQKKEYTGFREIVRSFFSLKSTDHNPMANAVFKSGIATSGLSLYFAKFLERADEPMLVGTVLLTFGLFGISTTIMGTADSIKRRKIERERKLQRATL